MSHADTQFRYISGNTLSSSANSTVDRSIPFSDSGSNMAAVARRSSSVTSRRRESESRDTGTATLRWSKRSYSVQDLQAREFKRRFPLLARVTQRCRCSDVNGFKLDVGQVFPDNC